jgi:hypothetical protein
VQEVPRWLEVADEVQNPSFSLLLSAKDVGCCLEVSRELGIPMTVGAAVSQVFTRTVAAGLGGHSPIATLLQVEKEAGVKIRTKSQPGWQYRGMSSGAAGEKPSG